MFSLDPALVGVLRGLHLITLLTLVGALVFRVVVAPPVLAMAPDPARLLLPGLRRWIWGCAIAALASGATWFVAEAGAIAEVNGLGDLPAATLDVALFTRFGHLMVVRGGLLLACVGLIGRSDRAAALLVLAASALQGGLGHAGATPGAEGVSLVISEALHLAAAGAWFGSLPLLWRWLGVLPLPAAACTCRRFSPLGLAAVLVLAGTGLLQSLSLVATVPGLIGTDYGLAALAKVVLFAVMVGLALYNRLALTDRLSRGGNDARARFRLCVMIETVAGVLVIAAAALLASLTPAAHEQPEWPFSWQPSLGLLSDDELRQELLTSALLVGLAAAAATVSLFVRQGRIVAFAALGLALASRGSSFGLLLAPAYPTSFYTSPTGFAASGIVDGQARYGALCAGCHGASGHGDGAAARGLPVRPADLTAPHLLEHPDGELFWWISHGIEDPDLGRVMPGFGHELDVTQRWNMIDYLRAMNAGTWFAAQGSWPATMPAPAVPIRCGDARLTQMQDLRGRVVQVAADQDATASPDPPVTRLYLNPQGSEACVVANADAWAAYAVLAGSSPKSLRGAIFLIDASGWLRKAYVPGQGAPMPDSAQLASDIQQIRANPISTAVGGGHEHHQH